LRRVFVVATAFLTQVLRCSRLQELSRALGYGCDLVRGGLRGPQLAIRARVQPLGACLLAEEIYGRRLSWHWHDPSGRPSVVLLQQGHAIAELGTRQPQLLLLQASARNGAVLAAAAHDMTITQAPCRLVRLVLPVGSQLQGTGALSVDLTLLLPMLRLLEQSLQHPAEAHTRQELGATLLAYVFDRLAAAGCVIELPPAASAGDSGDVLEQLEQWLIAHLLESLELADLAAAVNLSPRRLQELCRSKRGCTPMDLLRQHRLALLAQQLQDPQLARRSLRGLLDNLHLSDSAATRQAFVRLYGLPPVQYRQQRLDPRRSALPSGC
jgi:AraC-like DNA-binding protein